MTKPLPKFPNFRPYTIDDTSWYYDFYLKKGLSPYVDINPENLFVWLNINNDLMISKLDNAVILRYTNILDDNQINIIPIINPLSDTIVKKIMSYLKDNNLTQKINEIPSIICGELDQSKWLIENDRDSYEYILDTNEQSTLQGNNFYHRRRNIRHFEQLFTEKNVDVHYYKNINIEVKKAFMSHINTMPFNSREESSRQNTTEPIVIRRNLDYSSIFHKKAMIIKINNKIVSVTILSYLDNNTAAINHIKVDYSIPDIFRYTIYRLSKILKKDGINEMNMEQDLGMPGLRIYKKHLQPSRLLKKKIIRPRHP